MKSARTLSLAAVLAMAMARSSSAFAPKGLGHERDFVTVGRDARGVQHTAWTTSAARGGGLGGWKIMWDRDTGVPLRMWGPGVAARGAVADAAIAEAAARRFLADHLDVLAPGASVADFVLVSNQLGAGNNLRTVGFEQRAHGLRVLGGTVGFGLRGDRLTMVSSTALPDVHAAAPSSRLSAAGLAANAVTWLAGSGHVVRARSAAGASLLGTPGGIAVCRSSTIAAARSTSSTTRSSPSSSRPRPARTESGRSTSTRRLVRRSRARTDSNRSPARSSSTRRINRHRSRVATRPRRS